MAYEDHPAINGVTSSSRTASNRQELPGHPIHGEVDPLSVDPSPDDVEGTEAGPQTENFESVTDSGWMEAAGAESAIDSAIHTLIAAVRQECARERKRERDNLMNLFQQRVHQMEIEANRRLRDKLTRARERDREKLEERSMRLDTLFAQLNRLAREVAEQKQVLRSSRDELEAKLIESDLIQSELRNIGLHLGEQIEHFGDSLPDDSFIEKFEPKRQARG
jgi:hypothetical protein